MSAEGRIQWVSNGACRRRVLLRATNTKLAANSCEARLDREAPNETLAFPFYVVYLSLLNAARERPRHIRNSIYSRSRALHIYDCVDLCNTSIMSVSILYAAGRVSRGTTVYNVLR